MAPGARAHRAAGAAPWWSAACGDAYNKIQPDYLAVQPNSTYHLSAWLRGEIVLRYALDARANAKESAGNWILRAYSYDANKSPLSYVNADLSSSAPANWSERGGDFSTPANAAYVRIQLYNYHNSGWVAWDDLQLTGPQVTTLYYYVGGQRVAMRKNGVLRWLAGDHPSSDSGQAWVARRSRPTPTASRARSCATRLGARRATLGVTRPPATATPGSGKMV